MLAVAAVAVTFTDRLSERRGRSEPCTTDAAALTPHDPLSDAFFVSFFVSFVVCFFVRFFVRFFIHFRMTEPTDPASAHSRASVDATAPAAAHRHIRSFAMRRGHVTEAQKRAFADVLPRVAVPYAAQPLDLAATFGRSAPCVLEIGFGMGDATARIAQARPDVDFLGVEVFAAGVGALCKRIDEMQLGNIRIVQHDAVEVVRDMLAPDLLAGAHIYFPDPWPKARHHKRRLVQPAFIAQLVTRIAPGGYLHCATDWQHYAEQMLAVLSAEPQLANAHDGFAPDARNPLVERPTTKFHARGERLGHGVWDLVFLRR